MVNSAVLELRDRARDDAEFRCCGRPGCPALPWEELLCEVVVTFWTTGVTVTVRVEVVVLVWST